MQKRLTAGNEDTQLLKIIAGVCMICDHVGGHLLTSIGEMRIIGRIAFPLYVWCLVVGACYTRKPYKYALRLLIAGLISQPFYMIGLVHGWNKLNVFATLLTGYLAIWGIREKKYYSHIWAPLGALILACYVDMDYSWRGVALIILLYLARKSRGGIAAAMAAFCLFWGTTSSALQTVFGIPVQVGLLKQGPFALFTRLQALAILALPLMLWRREDRLQLPHAKLAYLVYPGHLLILWIIELLLGVVTMAGSMKLLIPWM